jgi:hypothetical protein
MGDQHRGRAVRRRGEHVTTQALAHARQHKACQENSNFCLSPEGSKESSPALQCWVDVFLMRPSRQTSELVRQDFLADVINKIGRELSRGF